MVNFLIITTGFNCARYVSPCIDSLIFQTPGNYTKRIVAVNDGSTDLTDFYLNPYSGRHISIIHNQHNCGAAYSRLIAIKKYGRPGDIVVLVGLDDRLLLNALNVIAEKYAAGCWVTYGNWINQNGRGLPPDFDLNFDDETHKSRNYRLVKYRSTAPNTFKIELFNAIPDDEFKLNGKWIDTTTESHLMFSCLEMAGRDRIGVIHEPIYVYNELLPKGTQRRLGQSYKNAVYAEMIKRPKKPLYEYIEHLPR
jgi:glycosyltransferase involved in cell wall biosynthesis